MPLDKEALKQLAETLSQGMLGNIEHNSAHNDEVDEQDYQRSLQVQPPEVGESGISPENAPEPPAGGERSVQASPPSPKEWLS